MIVIPPGGVPILRTLADIMETLKGLDATERSGRLSGYMPLGRPWTWARAFAAIGELSACRN